MKHSLKLIILVIAVILLSACHRETLKGSGKVVTQTRQVPQFEHIKAHGDVKLFVTAGKPQQVAVKTDDNLQSYIATTVKGDSLEISTKGARRLVPSTPIVIEVSAEELESLATAGSIQTEVKGIEEDSFDVRASGNSQLVLEGRTDKASINIEGNGQIDARQLITKEMSLSVSGVARAIVHAERKLDVKVAGDGEVIYFGNPPFLNQSIFGKGKVEKRSAQLRKGLVN
ncbi:head GIN domain-containing protein [Coxiella burnetii]